MFAKGEGRTYSLGNSPSEKTQRSDVLPHAPSPGSKSRDRPGMASGAVHRCAANETPAFSLAEARKPRLSCRRHSFEFERKDVPTITEEEINGPIRRRIRSAVSKRSVGERAGGLRRRTGEDIPSFLRILERQTETEGACQPRQLSCEGTRQKRLTTLLEVEAIFFVVVVVVNEVCQRGEASSTREGDELWRSGG